jgi:hypothetical protein
MKLGIVIVVVTVLTLGSITLFANTTNNKPQITSPMPLTGLAFPTLTPTPTPTPTPTLTPTPTPSPTPTPVPLTSTELENFFTQYANLYSVDKNLLRKIAACESGFNTNAVYMDYAGLFQFSTGAWINSRALMGQDGNLALRTNAQEAIKTAAFKISRGEVSAWPNCSK